MKHLTKIVLNLGAAIAASSAMAAEINFGVAGAGGSALTYADWNSACSTSAGITTPGATSCGMQPTEQLVKVYKVAVCKDKPSAPTTTVAASFSASSTTTGCSTIYESVAGQEINFSVASKLSGATRAGVGVYTYLYMEIDPQIKIKGSVKLPANLIAGVRLTNAGTGYSGSLVGVTFNGGSCSPTPTAQAIEDGGVIKDVVMTNSTPVVCSTRPTSVTIAAGTGTQATAAIVYGGAATSPVATSDTVTNIFDGATSYLTTGQYCWTSGDSSDIIYDWRPNFSNPFLQPSYMQCGDTLPATAAMGYNTVRFNGLNSGANFSGVNAPISNGKADGSAAKTSAMDFFMVKADGTLPTSGSANNANGITKVIGVIKIGFSSTGSSQPGVLYVSDIFSGKQTLGFNNSRGAKLENGGTSYPGLIYRLGPSSLDGTFYLK